MSSLTETIDRYLDRLQARLPAMAAAALRVQRRAGKRAVSMICDAAASVQSSRANSAQENDVDRVVPVEPTATHAEPAAESISPAEEEIVVDPEETPSAATVDTEEALPGETLEDLTKRELYERATAMNIAGRSSMNKAQLIEAIRGALRRSSS